MARLIFVTGTDTGVGKTTVTALLLAHSLGQRLNARALKPFSSGDRADELLLAGIQGSDAPANLFHFDAPIAPWSAARRAKVTIHDDAVLQWIREQSATCDLLLIEGAGGLLTPLGEGLDACVLIEKLDTEVILVTRNRLGVLNQALLAITVLRSRGVKKIKLALVEDRTPDYSAETNYDDLCALNRDLAIVRLPWLEGDLSDPHYIKACSSQFPAQLNALLSKKNPPDTDPRGLFP